MPIHVGVCSVVADALEGERFHQQAKQIGRVFGLYRPPQELGVIVVQIADEMRVPSQPADRTHQGYRVGRRSPVLEAAEILGASIFAGPILFGPGFDHRSRLDRSRICPQIPQYWSRCSSISFSTGRINLG